MLNEKSKEIGLHCRLSHFTTLIVCIAVLIALSFNEDEQLRNTHNDVKNIKTLQKDWKKLKTNIESKANEIKNGTVKYESFATVTIANETYDFIINADLQEIWIPYHSHLYDFKNNSHHYNMLSHSGQTVTEFTRRWNWSSDLVSVYIPTKVLPLLTVKRALIDNQWAIIDHTIHTTVTKVKKFSQDFTRGKSSYLCIISFAQDDGGTLFGKFPGEHSIKVGTSNLTIRGGSNSSIPLYRQVENTMHIAQSYSTRCWDKTSETPTYTGTPGKIVSIDIKVPTEGKYQTLRPLVGFSKERNIDISSGDKFRAIFPSADSLPDPYKEVEIGLLAEILNHQLLSSSDKSLEIVGLKIPIKIITQWGVLIMAIVYLYFILHFDAFIKSLMAKDNTGWDIPWVVVYNSPIAKIISVLTVIAIPLLVVSIGYWIVAPSTHGTVTSLVLYGSVSCVIGASIWSSICLYKLWLNHPEKRAVKNHQ